jgi:hypothetical protein
MIAAIDTNVLLDVLLPNDSFCDAAMEAPEDFNNLAGLRRIWIRRDKLLLRSDLGLITDGSCATRITCSKHGVAQEMGKVKHCPADRL